MLSAGFYLMFIAARILTFIIIGLVSVSCQKKEDLGERAELDELEAVIVEKEIELDLLKEEVKERKTSDPSEELASTELSLADLAADIELTEQGARESAAELKKIQKELKDYRAQYPIRKK